MYSESEADISNEQESNHSSSFIPITDKHLKFPDDKDDVIMDYLQSKLNKANIESQKNKT